MLKELNERSRLIFRQLVETYLETGEPVGSQTLAGRLDVKLSPASVRNVLSLLENSGLLYSPHTSAGRVPTEPGLRLFVDGLLEVGNLSEQEQSDIEGRCAAAGRHVEDVLTEAVTTLSGLCHCASLVAVPNIEKPIKHMEFVRLDSTRALVVSVGHEGNVENRIIDLPPGTTPATLTQAGNYLNARLGERALEDVRVEILDEIEARQAEIDALTSRLVTDGIAAWSGNSGQNLIVRGRSNLLDDVEAIEDLEITRRLFDDLENKRDLLQLLDLSRDGEGVRIFIGAENKLFSLSGSSLIVSPYMNAQGTVIGALGVIGPTRVNYARIVPMVDYTAQVVSRLVG